MLNCELFLLGRRSVGGSLGDYVGNGGIGQLVGRFQAGPDLGPVGDEGEVLALSPDLGTAQDGDGLEVG